MSIYNEYAEQGKKEPKKDGYKVTHNITRKYLKLRSAIGILGILLPFLLVGFSLINKNGCGILPSISDYFHTSVGGIFIGILVSIAIFLIYDGENKEEKYICRAAGVLALIIAFAPTPIKDEFVLISGMQIDPDMFGGCYIPKMESNSLIGYIHFGAATFFFLLLSYLAGIKFRNSETKEDSTKLRRNWYAACGLGMLVPLIGIAIFKIFFNDQSGDSETLPIVFIAEFIMLIFFGISWLIRGEVMLNKSSNYLEG